MKQLDPKAVWLFFIGSFARLALPAGVLAGYTLAMLGGGENYGSGAAEWLFSNIVFILVILFLFFVIFAFIWARLSYYYYRYELREDGFRKEHGVIWKKYVTIPYDRIQNVDIFRGFIARILGLSDLQIQTAGGITAGSYGAFSEGRLPGLSYGVAEELRDEVIRRARQSKNQGL